jgi:hypothetical protein
MCPMGLTCSVPITGSTLSAGGLPFGSGLEVCDFSQVRRPGPV